MNYDEIIRRVSRLDFIRNDQTADEAVKAVLGTFAGTLSEEQARKLIEKFPALPTRDIFGDESKRAETISVAKCTEGICVQFKISLHQARTLIRNVLYFTKEASGVTDVSDIKKNLPKDWADAIQNA